MLGVDETRNDLRHLIKQAQGDLTGESAEALLGFLDLYQKVL